MALTVDPESIGARTNFDPCKQVNAGEIWRAKAKSRKRRGGHPDTVEVLYVGRSYVQVMILTPSREYGKHDRYKIEHFLNTFKFCRLD